MREPVAERIPLALLRRAAAALVALAAPPRCRLCRAPLFGHANPFLCPVCALAMPWVGEGACRKCGFPAGPHADIAGGCGHCRGKRLRLTAAAAVARYRGPARRLVLALKFGGERELARPMAGLMAERLRSADLPAPDLVAPVALHRAKLAERGFNQARLLAGELARAARLPFRPDLLARTRNTPPQSSLGREARRENMDRVFRAAPETEGKTVLLVDDVMTTGATLADCARACREAGARHVAALVFAR